VHFVEKRSNLFALRSKTWLFWVLSGLAMSASWVCSFRALKVGDGSKVVPVDELSFRLIGVFAVIFFARVPN
jgi:bacterial/archaeal transporter family protein